MRHTRDTVTRHMLPRCDCGDMWCSAHGGCATVRTLFRVSGASVVSTNPCNTDLRSTIRPGRFQE